MSPPCQPYTRAGLRLGAADSRAKALHHLISLLRRLHDPPEYLVLENVKGFEVSESCRELLECLSDLGFDFRQMILDPTQFAIPNERLRYYVVARRRPRVFFDMFSKQDILCFIPNHSSFDSSPLQFYSISDSTREKLEELSIEFSLVASDSRPSVPLETTRSIGMFLDDLNEEELDAFYVSDSLLSKSRGYCFDIVKSDSIRTCCFTKSYSRFIKGTGSVVQTIEIPAFAYDFNHPERLSALKLRYFTPEELLKLHGYPEGFQWPKAHSTRSKYALIGNGLSVVVARQIVEFLFS